MSLLRPRTVEVRSEIYLPPNSDTEELARTLYLSVIKAYREGADFSSLSLRRRQDRSISSDTVVEFWMTDSSNERYPLFGDVCFMLPGKNRYCYAFSEGEKFREMVRDRYQPYFAVSNLKQINVPTPLEEVEERVITMPPPQIISFSPAPTSVVEHSSHKQLERFLRKRGTIK